MPDFRCADRYYRLGVVGRERAGAQEILVLALVQRGALDLHYRLWDAPLNITAP